MSRLEQFTDDDDPSLFERPSFRLGKLKKGRMGSRRRQGEHRCMGWCSMCNWEAGHDSISHYRKKQAGEYHRVVVDSYPDGTRIFFRADDY